MMSPLLAPPEFTAVPPPAPVVAGSLLLSVLLAVGLTLAVLSL